MTKEEISRVLQTDFARTLRKPFVYAMRKFRLVQPGDRVAACISGGKDSMLLALLLREAQRTVDFELCYLAMDPGYSPAGRAKLEDNAALFGIPLCVFETNVLRVAQNHAAEHPCFLCSKMRRGYLYAEAQRRACNKIALGHHFDDAIESVLMGLLYGGQVQAMLPRVRSKHFEGMELIRPLYFVRERDVTVWTKACSLAFLPCDCPAKSRESDTKRAEIKALIASLAARNPQVERNILNAVKNVDTAKVLGWRDQSGRHSFLDGFECNT